MYYEKNRHPDRSLVINIKLFFLLYSPKPIRMSDRHRDRYISKLLVGFSALICFVTLLFLIIFEELTEQGDWYWWALAASALLCTGVYFSIAASVHKIKSDCSRRRKSGSEGQ